MEKRDYLYEYLVYFWKKKWLIVGIPLAAALLAYGLSIVSSSGYEGSAKFYTSEMISDYLTDPELLQKEYGGKYDDKVQVDVLGQYKVEFSVSGEDKASVEKVLNEASAEYFQSLEDEAEIIKSGTEEKRARNQELLETAEKSYEVMSERLQNDSENLDSEQMAIMSDAIAKLDKQIGLYTDTVLGTEKDLNFYEEPDILSQTVSKEDSNSKANALVGFIMGLFLTLLGLMLAKYLQEARKARIDD
ncbi:hypothetical protein [Metabacillus sp. 84]|uniref:hypothetical protein n=1 Tax=Metabacillus sp. 84 TaxID=3404705 RepID=UPI003CEE1ECD